MTLRPYAILALLWGVYFHPLILHPTQVLYADYSDFLAEHLPAKLFLNREWKETGELPLWNPYHFCGTPLVHDIQVGCFYPPYAVMYVVPEEWLGAALSWVIALHVLAAGCFAFIYARSHDLGEAGSLVAAAGFMLSAKWMTHLLLAGHSITVGLAWLPLVLLGLEKAIEPASRLRLLPIIGAGVALALLILGTHPQWAFYAGLFIAAWTVPIERTRRNLLRWLGVGVGIGAIALLLCSVQLLPTLEASRYSSRTIGIESSGSLSLALPTFLGLIGPSFINDPPRSWEVRGLFGACWLAAALAAPKFAAGRARWQLGVLLAMLFFSLGGAVLVEWLPGFRLFRVPGRMLLIAAFPVAYLAGTTTKALGWGGTGFQPVWEEHRLEAGATQKTMVRRCLLFIAIVAVLPSLIAAIGGMSQGSTLLWPPGLLGWICLVVAIPVGYFGLRNCKPLWLVALFLELLGPTILLPEVRPLAAIYPRSETVRFLQSQTGRVLDRDNGDNGSRPSVLGTGEPLALVYRIETIRGYNPLDVRHYREFLGFIEDDPRPSIGNSRRTQQVIPPVEVVNPQLFDLLSAPWKVGPASETSVEPWQTVAFDPGPPAVPPLLPGVPRILPEQRIERNQAAFPRAFVVPNAAAMPPGRELESLKSADLRKMVLLHNSQIPASRAASAAGLAQIVIYRPNRVVIDLGESDGGFLVLADVWFPGWTCRIDGVEVPVHRANHAFRAVALPSGAKQAMFQFEPQSYRIGWWVSAVSVGACSLIAIAYLLRRTR